ncbi:MAG: glycosyltransferase family 2 protein, partial [Cyanobacteria bacterium NC_groundwater_1444_Ag_S-0.65um_54_12]|nr:glycosyltransferase family 2 protein [Cyanobacteria bacterium NC_groundwater_1444_Ag_S-0.65um_54_12]
MRLSVIIPVFNELATIEQVLARVRAVPLAKQIILVDDGSSDGTRKILDGERAAIDTTVVFHAANQGKGAAIRTGLRYVAGEFVIIQDADLE